MLYTNDRTSAQETLIKGQTQNYVTDWKCEDIQDNYVSDVM